MVSKDSLMNRITVDPGVCGGQPCLRGQRIRVTDVLELLSSGATVEQIVEDYSTLETDDVLAAIEYAARQIDHAVLRSHIAGLTETFLREDVAWGLNGNP